ncbi:hypothetical protein PYCC9005_005647 [Savitreella phatthalungensis]
MGKRSRGSSSVLTKRYASTSHAGGGSSSGSSDGMGVGVSEKLLQLRREGRPSSVAHRSTQTPSTPTNMITSAVGHPGLPHPLAAAAAADPDLASLLQTSHTPYLPPRPRRLHNDHKAIGLAAPPSWQTRAPRSTPTARSTTHTRAHAHSQGVPSLRDTCIRFVGAHLRRYRGCGMELLPVGMKGELLGGVRGEDFEVGVGMLFEGGGGVGGGEVSWDGDDEDDVCIETLTLHVGDTHPYTDWAVLKRLPPLRHLQLVLTHHQHPTHASNADLHQLARKLPPGIRHLTLLVDAVGAPADVGGLASQLSWWLSTVSGKGTVGLSTLEVVVEFGEGGVQSGEGLVNRFSSELAAGEAVSRQWYGSWAGIDTFIWNLQVKETGASDLDLRAEALATTLRKAIVGLRKARDCHRSIDVLVAITRNCS